MCCTSCDAEILVLLFTLHWSLLSRTWNETNLASKALKLKEFKFSNLQKLSWSPSLALNFKSKQACVCINSDRIKDHYHLYPKADPCYLHRWAYHHQGSLTCILHQRTKCLHSDPSLHLLVDPKLTEAKDKSLHLPRLYKKVSSCIADKLFLSLVSL
jgi:hypothetical protein